MRSRSKSVAIFIDGENISAIHASRILSYAKKGGLICLSRVYGSAYKIPEWEKAPEFQFVHAGTGKNASDLLLAIDAIEYAITYEIGTVYIASSDGDFSHLANKLRNRGIEVVGVGDQKAPEKFRAACCEFHILRKPINGEVEPRIKSPSTATDFDLKIRSVIASGSKNGSGLPIKTLATQMSQQFQTKISALPEKNWRKYLNKREELYDLDPRGPDALVRFKPSGF